MRGAHYASVLVMEEQRIIPADAGSTAARPLTAKPHQDHPRGCGEHCSHTLSPSDVAGSSPRMRGALLPRMPHNPVTGIIPADAGSTICPEKFGCLRKDHPRGCGEHETSDIPYRKETGSSPRMRGARHQHR